MCNGLLRLKLNEFFYSSMQIMQEELEDSLGN